MVPLVALSALLLGAPAHALDVDLWLTAPGAETQVMSLVDVEEGALPTFAVEADDGSTWLFGGELSLVLNDADDLAVRLALTIDKLEPARRGRLERSMVARPVVTTSLGEEAQLALGRGARVDSGGEVVSVEELVEVRAVVRE